MLEVNDYVAVLTVRKKEEMADEDAHEGAKESRQQRERNHHQDGNGHSFDLNHYCHHCCWYTMCGNRASRFPEPKRLNATLLRPT